MVRTFTDKNILLFKLAIAAVLSQTANGWFF
jgi:hypothetical protein